MHGNGAGREVEEGAAHLHGDERDLRKGVAEVEAGVQVHLVQLLLRVRPPDAPLHRRQQPARHPPDAALSHRRREEDHHDLRARRRVPAACSGAGHAIAAAWLLPQCHA